MINENIPLETAVEARLTATAGPTFRAVALGVTDFTTAVTGSVVRYSTLRAVALSMAYLATSIAGAVTSAVANPAPASPAATALAAAALHTNTLVPATLATVSTRDEALVNTAR